MKIQEMDVYHGPALMQIVEHGSFKALNKTDKKYGHYTVNTDRHIFVKYRKHKNSPWRFQFGREELAAIRRAIKEGSETFACLVCDHSTICCLNEKELATLIELDSKSEQWIRIEVPPGGSQHVSGSRASLMRTIPHNAFPDKVLG